MIQVAVIGLDLGQRVLQVHGADAGGRAVLGRKLHREQVRGFFSGLPPCPACVKPYTGRTSSAVPCIPSGRW